MNIPFIHPYTMPDGTTRRPLAERVPACCPINHGTLVAVGTSIAPDGRVQPANGDTNPNNWRASVHDWLRDVDVGNAVFADISRCLVRADLAEMNSKSHAVADMLEVPN